MVRQPAGMDMPGGIGWFGLSAELVQVADIFVHRAGDDVEIQPLGRLRLVVHEL